jgi:hypothetical protein
MTYSPGATAGRRARIRPHAGRRGYHRPEYLVRLRCARAAARSVCRRRGAGGKGRGDCFDAGGDGWDGGRDHRAEGGAARAEVRKTPSWPRSWANFSLL